MISLKRHTTLLSLILMPLPETLVDVWEPNVDLTSSLVSGAFSGSSITGSFTSLQEWEKDRETGRGMGMMEKHIQGGEKDRESKQDR